MRHLFVLMVLTCPLLGVQAAAQESGGDAAARPEVLLKTTEGEILIELNREKAPKTVENFLQYVRDGHYEGTVFHRVIPGFMIQGGGMTEELKEKETRDPVPNEAGNELPNKKYSLAMARTSDPDSATSQFFINVADNSFLNRDLARGNHGYTVFGRVVKGLETVDKISQVKTQSKPGPRGLLYDDVPVKPVVIQSAKVVEKKD